MRRSIVMVAGFGVAAALVGCSSKDDHSAKVTMNEYGIAFDDPKLDAGKITFELKNTGGLAHEFVVFKVDSVADVPTLPSGEADEEGIPEADHMGEMENVASGTTEKFELELEAGSYVALCNLVNDDGSAHFAQGMSTTFTVS